MDEIIYDCKPAPFPIVTSLGIVFLLWVLYGGRVALVEECQPRMFVRHHLLVRLRRGDCFLVGIIERPAIRHMGGIFCGGVHPLCPQSLGA